MADKATPDASEARHARADEGSAAGATAGSAAENTLSMVGRSEPRPKPSLITAIEIENFKGIGAPVRIELRPITLLFGRNSAGKSTILQALCYADEIMSRRNFDARKTERGGDKIDLGGFRQLVHRHELNRTVRLRFGLNLKGWSVPDSLVEKVAHRTDDASLAYDYRQLVGRSASGWVELAVRAPRPDATVLEYCEVGVDGERVARLEEERKLTINWRHPLLASLIELEEPDDSVELHGFDLPNWDEPLALTVALTAKRRRGQEDGRRRRLPRRGGVPLAILDESRCLLSLAYIGIGAALRDELKELRYLGPVRELRPRTGGAQDPHRKGHWSDGSAAWHSLVYHDPRGLREEKDPINAVNDWLSQGDRRDARYKLRRRSIVQLPADKGPVREIRKHQGIFGNYLDERGTTDYDRWLRELVTKLKSVGEVPEEQDLEYYREVTGDLKTLAADVDKLQRGRPPSAVKALVRAVATAPAQNELELLAEASDTTVRTADVGVGISQILPVVVAVLAPRRPGITAIEQPELHVHPRMQVELGDLFAQGAGPAGIFLIETHSEHLILRLLRRIAETHSGELPEGKPALQPDQVSVVFLEQMDGEVRATQLQIDETGEFMDRWPQGFFDERSGELFF